MIQVSVKRRANFSFLPLQARHSDEFSKPPLIVDECVELISCGVHFRLLKSTCDHRGEVGPAGYHFSREGFPLVLSRKSDPIYRQLFTQVTLAILSGDQKPGDRLPSTRELARRFSIHPNTVSAGYRQLAQEGWVEYRHGNGVYIKSDATTPSTPEQILDQHIAAFFRAVRELRLPFHFHLVPNRGFVNAFALPGGQLFIGQGLLDLMKSEDEIAFVLGHEIEHIDHFHSVELVQVEARLHKLNLGALGELAQIPIELSQAGYSKDEEAEPDREGLRLASVSGYSPRGALDLLNRFVQLHQEYVIHAKTLTDELSQTRHLWTAGLLPLTSTTLGAAGPGVGGDRRRSPPT